MRRRLFNRPQQSTPARSKMVPVQIDELPGDNRESLHDRITVAVIAPGACTNPYTNGAIYSELGGNPSYKVEIVGQSGEEYDHYPPCWKNGKEAPNLQTFADAILATRVHERVHCMVFGSRGGQVVLPQMWQAQAQGSVQSVPPVVVINGGCAMQLPQRTIWPDKQVLLALIGGKDFFRGHLSFREYITETRSHVPAANKTTAILFVQEMDHRPQQRLFRGLLGLMLETIAAWKEQPKVPFELFRKILSFLRRDGWSGVLLYTTAPNTWEEITFPNDIDKVEGVQAHEDPPRAPVATMGLPVTRKIWTTPSSAQPNVHRVVGRAMIGPNDTNAFRNQLNTAARTCVQSDSSSGPPFVQLAPESRVQGAANGAAPLSTANQTCSSRVGLCCARIRNFLDRF
eukprot:Skav233273  [mRNA]  locus=scaffold3673:17109:18308:- [translate_table: standard]